MATVTCRKCGLENDDHALVCARCGLSLVVVVSGDTKHFDAPETLPYVVAGTRRFSGATRLQFHIKDTKEPLTVDIRDQLSIGRGEKADVDLSQYGAEAKGVSRLHALITRNGDSLMLTDLSSNGTWVNGERLASSTPVQLQEGVHIWIANLEMILFFTS